MMNTMKLEYFICMSLKRLLFVSCRFPAFEDEYIKRNIDKPTTSKEELKCYLSNSTSTGRKRALILVIIYITYCFKNAYIPYQSFSTLNYDNLESNIKTHSEIYDKSFNSKSSTSFKSFACLWTNCSRLSARTAPDDASTRANYLTQHYRRHERPSAASDLAHDVIVLPLFALCSPIAELLYTPVVKLDSVGVLISAAACLNVFLLGSYTTIQQFIMPASNEMIMFICAPTVTASIARTKASQLFFDIMASFQNFRSKPVWKHKRANLIMRIQRRRVSARDSYSASLVPSGMMHSLSNFTLDKSGDINTSDCDNLYRRQSLRIRALIEQADAIYHTKQLLAMKPGRPCCAGATTTTTTKHTNIKRNNLNFVEEKTPEKQIDEITESCLPIIRTEWYRAYSARVFYHMLILAMSLIGLIGLSAFSFITYKAHIKSHELRQVALEIERQNCSLWRATQASVIGGVDTAGTIHSSLGEVVELGRVEFGWNWFAMLLGFVNLIPGFTVAALFAYYWCFLSEGSIWLAELRMLLVASLVVAKYKISPENNSFELSGFLASRRLRRTSRARQYHHPPLALARVRRSSGALGRDETLEGLRQLQQVLVNDSKTDEEVGNAINTEWRWSTPGIITNPIKTEHFYRMKPLRERFQRQCLFIKLTFLSRFEKDNGENETRSMNSRRCDQHHFRHFVDQLFFQHTRSDYNLDKERPSGRAPVVGGLCLRATALRPPLVHLNNYTSELECMEQIYVNFRLFVDHVLGCAPSVRVVLAITYLLNYGLVFIAIMCSRKMATLKAEPMCIVVFGWVISNFLILLGANFHADAKKLQPLLWSIIAQLTRSENLRAQHMRLLWTKQAQMLDDSGGLALSAFGLRVTYVNIIQLALGTATIIVISIRPN